MMKITMRTQVSLLRMFLQGRLQKHQLRLKRVQLEKQQPLKRFQVQPVVSISTQIIYLTMLSFHQRKLLQNLQQQKKEPKAVSKTIKTYEVIR